jgi:hypothetical protein
MGIDDLDIMLRVENAAGVVMAQDDWNQLRAQCKTNDATVGELHDILVSKGRPTGCDACVVCDYSLSGHITTTRGRCPECGTEFDMTCITFDELRHILVKAIGVEPKLVTREAFLIRDLRMNR